MKRCEILLWLDAGIILILSGLHPKVDFRTPRVYAYQAAPLSSLQMCSPLIILTPGITGRQQLSSLIVEVKLECRFEPLSVGSTSKHYSTELSFDLPPFKNRSKAAWMESILDKLL